MARTMIYRHSCQYQGMPVVNDGHKTLLLATMTRTMMCRHSCQCRSSRMPIDNDTTVLLLATMTRTMRMCRHSCQCRSMPVGDNRALLLVTMTRTMMYRHCSLPNHRRRRQYTRRHHRRLANNALPLAKARRPERTDPMAITTISIAALSQTLRATLV
jgi:hypothetical protein